METMTVTLSVEEIEDIRFCLAAQAVRNEDHVAAEVESLTVDQTRYLLSQVERFRTLARRVTGCK